MSEVCNRFERMPQLLRNVRFANGSPMEDRRVLAAIEAGRARLGATGRLLVRPSGTEPVIRVMAEGEDEHLVAAIVGDIVGVVQDVAQVA